MKPLVLNIFGIRGIPAAHGGFETFAERLSLYLVSRGWTVTVYCQDDAAAYADGATDKWHGVDRVHLRPTGPGPLGTIAFDLKCIRHARNAAGVDLVLGYNTALFTALQRLWGRRVVMNMDGIEWKRAKWGGAARIWFFVNEVAGANLAQVLIADHPEIARHVARRCFRTPVMIPYGSDAVTGADTSPLRTLGLEPQRYFVSVARIEPENSILDFVKAAASLPRGYKMAILGKLDPANPYHRLVRSAAGQNVVFPGAIYDQTVVQALRFHAIAYLHGHRVGGTNPSLVEALGAGCVVLAHDNRFNRWTAGPTQFYFHDSTSAAMQMNKICLTSSKLSTLRAAARERHSQAFLWPYVLRAYESLLEEQIEHSRSVSVE